MSSQDENFSLSDIVKMLKEHNVNYNYILVIFFVFFLLFIIISPNFVKYITDASPLKIEFLVLNPFEIILNYCKISFFMALSVVLPLLVYQFSKLKIDFSDEDDKKTAVSYSLILYFIIFSAFFFALKILLPAEVMLLYGFNFFGISNASSFTAFFSLFLVNYILSALCFSIPMMSKYTFDLPVLDYRDFDKYQTQIYYLFGFFAILLVLPFELIACGLVFLIFCFFYRLAYKFAMRNKDE